MSEWAVQLDRVSFTYEGTQREILHEVSLNVKPGEFLTIVGPNGAGKSTLVRTMIGLNRPTSGRVLVEGKDLSKLTVAQLSRTVGFLFQNPDHQLFEDTVYREIAVANGHPEWEQQIRETFARQWVSSARGGWWYQDAGGAWKQK